MKMNNAGSGDSRPRIGSRNSRPIKENKFNSTAEEQKKQAGAQSTHFCGAAQGTEDAE